MSFSIYAEAEDGGVFASPVAPIAQPIPGTDAKAGAFVHNSTPGARQQTDYSSWQVPCGSELCQGSTAEAADNGLGSFMHTASAFSRGLGQTYALSPKSAQPPPVPVSVGSADDPSTSLSGFSQLLAGSLAADSDALIGPYVAADGSLSVSRNSPALLRTVTASGAGEAPLLPLLSSYDQGYIYDRATGQVLQGPPVPEPDSIAFALPELDAAIGGLYVPGPSGPRGPVSVDSQTAGALGRFCSTSRVGQGPYNYLGNYVLPFNFGKTAAAGALVPFNPTDYNMCADGLWPTTRAAMSPARLSSYLSPNAYSPSDSLRFAPGIPFEYRDFLQPASSNSKPDPRSWLPATAEQALRGLVSAPSMAGARSNFVYHANLMGGITAPALQDGSEKRRTIGSTPAYRFTASTNLNFGGPAELNYVTHHADYPLREMGVMLYTRIGCDRQRPLVEKTQQGTTVSASLSPSAKFKSDQFRAVELMANSAFVFMRAPSASARQPLGMAKPGSGPLLGALLPAPQSLSDLLVGAINPFGSAALAAGGASVPMASALARFDPAQPQVPGLFTHFQGKAQDYVEAVDSAGAPALVELANDLQLDPSKGASLFKLPVTTVIQGVHSALFYEFQLGSMFVPPHLGLLFVDANGQLHGPGFVGSFADYQKMTQPTKFSELWFFAHENAPAGDGTYAALDQFTLGHSLSYKDRTGKLFRTADVRYATGAVVFERTDSLFMRRFGLQPTAGQSYSETNAQQLRPLADGFGPDSNVTRYNSLVFSEYFGGAAAKKPVNLFPYSLTQFDRTSAAIPYGGALRRLSRKWLAVLLTFANLFRQQTLAQAGQPSSATRSLSNKPTGWMQYPPAVDSMGAAVRPGSDEDTNALLRQARLFPEFYRGGASTAMQTSADYLMVHYTCAWLAHYYKNLPSVPEQQFDRTCQCLQYYQGLVRNAQGAVPPGWKPSLGANRAFSTYACVLQTGDSSIMCLDGSCNVRSPTPYQLAGTPAPCDGASINVSLQKEFCLAAVAVRQGGSSLSFDQGSVQQLCGPAEPFGTITRVFFDSGPPMVSRKKEGFECRPQLKYVSVVPMRYKQFFAFGKNKTWKLIPEIYAPGSQFPAGTTSVELADVCGKSPPIPLFLNAGGEPLTAENLGLALPVRLAVADSATRRVWAAQLLSFSLGTLQPTGYFDASGLIWAGDCGSSDSGSASEIFARAPSDLSAAASLADLEGSELVLITDAVSPLRSPASGTRFTDGNSYADYSTSLGPAISCASRNFTRFSLALSTGTGCSSVYYKTISAYGANSSFCDNTTFTDSIGSPLALGGSYVASLGGQSLPLDSTGRVTGPCYMCVGPSPQPAPPVDTGSTWFWFVLVFLVSLILSVIVALIVKRSIK